MEKLSLLVTLLGCVTLSAEIKEKKSSQTFYSMQPLFNVGNKMAGTGRLSLFSLDHSANVYAAGVVTQSYNSASTSQFFLFNNQSSLVIRGSAHGDYSANTTDVRADWLGLPTNFEGTLNLAPSFESWGIALRFKKSLATMTDISFLKRCALFLEIPVVHTKTSLAFTQSSVSNAGATTSAVYDILTAFNNTTWNYQKISKTGQETTSLAEVRLGLSNTFLASDRALVALSSALSIPTTKQYANTYMFEPQGGHNGHPGMISTVHIAVPLTLENSSTHFSFFVDAEHTFLFRTKQHRTFDLKDKPWSRFLLLREKDQTTNATIPGVNILTRNVRISPYSIFDALVGFKVASSYATFEVAFGAWGHHKGRIKFTDAWNPVYGIAGSTTNRSASGSTITTRSSDDSTFTPIYESDLNIGSALSPATVIYKAHIALDVHYTSDKWGIFTTCGTQLQIPRNSTNGFKTWSVFANIGASF